MGSTELSSPVMPEHVAILEGILAMRKMQGRPLSKQFIAINDARRFFQSRLSAADFW
jgi:hypothetical protein